MTLAVQIETKLREALAPSVLEVINESHMHGTASSDSHYKLVIVSAEFDGQRLLQRHRRVNKLLAAELAGELHALALHLYSPTEWQQLQQVPESPVCRGGSQQP
ncbi:BolA family transcriptional regulator [Pseudidiomarina aestuarii]|uniref:BolA family transcriptional regulator n=1 Tax=Pseudidiomarina aestuarii TaxID=624146 RepID=A0A7Z6ZUA5_9GAMM|nr:BolA/IbaG family iron-sulfur metabolism protein [Pseudidiomarina aestuarii]RUO41509.1 BolA family transcriptional regulator [Pseudidiomarina aestuarii]